MRTLVTVLVALAATLVPAATATAGDYRCPVGTDGPVCYELQPDGRYVCLRVDANDVCWEPQ